MRFGICASCQDVAELDAVPFDYLEESVQRFLAPERPVDDFAGSLRRAQSLPILVEAANSMLPPDLTLIDTPDRPVNHTRLERYMTTALRRAEQAGIRVIVFGSGDARACPPGVVHGAALRQIAEHLATWSRWAREHGVQIALEPLRYEETNTLNTVAEGGALVQGIADSGAALLADVYHMACNGEAPESMLPYAPLLAHVHVAEKTERAAPGRHGESFRPYFSVLHDVGYNCRISIECHWRNLAAEVEPAIAALREQWTDSVETVQKQ